MQINRQSTASARDTAARAVKLIVTLRRGDCAMIDLPTGIFSRMEAARRIGIEARRILGKNNYSVITRHQEGRAVVTYLRENKNAPSKYV